jgi:hypothetical protein
MRFYLILFFCVSIFFTSCGDSGNPDYVPSDLLQLHEMAALLADVHIVDGSLANVPALPDSMAKHGMGLYLAVFKAHNTDSTTFKKSFYYYASHPDLMNRVYTGINVRLTKKLDSLNKIKPKIDPDSIRRAKLKASADSITGVKARLKFESMRNNPSILNHMLPSNIKFKKQNALPAQ